MLRKGEPFTPNHTVLLAERPSATPVVAIDDSMAMFHYEGCEAAGGAAVSDWVQDSNADSAMTTDTESSNSDCEPSSADEHADNDSASGFTGNVFFQA